MTATDWIRRTESTDPKAKATALRALGNFEKWDDRQILPTLEKYVASPDRDVRLAACVSHAKVSDDTRHFYKLLMEYIGNGRNGRQDARSYTTVILREAYERLGPKMHVSLVTWVDQAHEWFAKGNFPTENANLDYCKAKVPKERRAVRWDAKK